MTPQILIYRRETLAATQPELSQLLAAHWDEVAHDQSSRQLDPDWATFAALEAAGQLYLLTVRQDGRLVGYLLAILRPHLHSRATLSAYVDAVYLCPEVRRGSVGARFLRHADLALAELADLVYWHVKPERNFGPILTRQLGYHAVETIYARSTQRGQPRRAATTPAMHPLLAALDGAH